MKKQICKTCETELKLTEIETKDSGTIYAYMCKCSDMVKESKRLKVKTKNYNKKPEFCDCYGNPETDVKHCDCYGNPLD